MSLFGRRPRPVHVPKLKPRRPSADQAVNRVSLAELTPDLPRYLGQAAYLQLSNVETISGAIASSPTTRDKVALTRVAKVSLGKLQGLLDEIERGGDTPEELMEYFAAPIDAFRAATRGADWYETVVTSYITASMLTDFFISLADGLPAAPRERIQAVLSDDPSPIIVKQLSAAIEAEPVLASRLALWGRRLVGDTLLVARSSLSVPGRVAPDEARLEPVFTELIAAHTRRMDALGLTA
ncbi:ferritin-like domain-containing protein [Salinibacterium sp. SYSU T00001]|uniref:ferritin-like domain-containing protein n=1 Tax=Homoserinimonas sedimenticola TaxID=2986805 RepID=UPI002235559A|nr:ferritin-like domain-containing protein [Salinibacterium sedimenticola]MCW4386515.1 ferritin-like domain-containing protein [Salinibacterium sedimenticola]